MNEYSFKINGKDYQASVNEEAEGVLAVTVNGKTYQVEVPHTQTAAPHIVRHAAAPVAAPAPVVAPKAAAVAVGAQTVTAPLPGTVKQIKVKVGDKVERGDVVLTMEAMKMENNICAEHAGTVKAVHVQSEQQVNQGEALVDIE